MKKLLYIIPLVLLLALLAACGTPEETTSTPEPVLPVSIWDGSVASSFAGGDGSEGDPYRIESAAQLAYLAVQVNSGEEYTDKHFVLKCDIDLNNIAWTPIGSGNIDRYYFEGHFDGCGATISNLKLTELMESKYIYELGSVKRGVGGLFGACNNATISNLNINNSDISIDNIHEYEEIIIGTLAGYIKSTSSCQIINIKITDSAITTKSSDPSLDLISVRNLYAAGMIGSVAFSEASQCKLFKLQSNVAISSEEAFKYNNYYGGIAGYITSNGNLECSDFASFLSLSQPSQNSDHYAGAFGVLGIYGTTFFSNGFSEVVVDEELIDVSGYYTYKANAIAGNIFQSRNLSLESVQFENLFGYVKLLDESADAKFPVLELYALPEHAKFIETNCKGCTALPENHSFDTSIWDISDSTRPILK